MGQAIHRRDDDTNVLFLNEALEHVIESRAAELRAANAELVEARLRLQEVSARLISAQEEERRRISRELHDDTGQALAAIKLRLEDALHNESRRVASIEECLRIVDQAVIRVRAMAVNLRPPMLDDLGLADAMQWALDQHAKSAGWQVRIRADSLPDQVPGDVQTACFRIAQEALTNAERHAEAHNVLLALQVADRHLELRVEDDGKGFDYGVYRSPQSRRQHFGLASMMERASLVGGRLEVESTRGSGTRIRARFPMS